MFGDAGTQKEENSKLTPQIDMAESSRKRLPPNNSFGDLSCDGDNQEVTPTKESEYSKLWHKELLEAYEKLNVPTIKKIIDCTLLCGKRNYNYENEYIKKFAQWLDQEHATWSQYVGIEKPGLDLRELKLRIFLLNCLMKTFNFRGSDEKVIRNLWCNLIQQYNMLHPSQKNSSPECKR